MSNVLHVLCFRMGSCIILASCQDPTTLWVTTVVKGSSTKLCGSTVHHNSLSFFSAKAKEVMEEHFFFFLLTKKPYSNWKIQKLKQTNWMSHSLLQWLKPATGTFKLQSRPNPLISSVSIFCNKNVGRRSSNILYLIELVWDLYKSLLMFHFFLLFFFPWFCYAPGTNFSLLLQHVQGRKSRMFEETAAKISWFVDRQDYEALWRRQNLLRAFCLQFLNQALDTCRSRSGRSFGLRNHASYSPMAVWPSLSFLSDWQNSQSKLTIKNL